MDPSTPPLRSERTCLNSYRAAEKRFALSSRRYTTRYLFDGAAAEEQEDKGNPQNGSRMKCMPIAAAVEPVKAEQLISPSEAVFPNMPSS